MSAPELQFILFKRRGVFQLAACRGQRKGCAALRDRRRKLPKDPCPDCIICRDDETIGEVMDRIARGDA